MPKYERVKEEPCESPTVLFMVSEYLKVNGYDGLCNADGECDCELADLAPCDEIGQSCTAGISIPCNCGECDLHTIEQKWVKREKNMQTTQIEREEEETSK